MINNFIEYKRYLGTVEYSAEDNILFGQITGIRGLISYEGSSIEQLRADFEEAIDDYLLDCEENGTAPQHPYSGNLNMKIFPDLHKRLQIYSKKEPKTKYYRGGYQELYYKDKFITQVRLSKG